MRVTTSVLEVAQRFVGVEEMSGEADHPLVQLGFWLCQMDPETPDEVPWCSAFAQVPAFVLGLPRSGSAMARSWLQVGTLVPPELAEPGDVVVLSRGLPPSGHVGFFVEWEDDHVSLLGGNQGDAVSVASFPRSRILGVRRLV